MYLLWIGLFIGFMLGLVAAVFLDMAHRSSADEELYEKQRQENAPR